MNKILQFLKVPKNNLMFVSLLISTAYSMLWPIGTLYITGYLGQTNSMSGLVLTSSAILAMIGNSVSGKLFDSWQPFKLLVMLISTSFIASLIMFFYNGWPIFAFLVLVLILANAMTQTLVLAYVPTLKIGKLRSNFSDLFITQNIGVVFGTAIVGIFFDKYGVPSLMAISLFLYALVFVSIFSNFRNIEKERLEFENENHSENTSKKFKMTPLILAIGLLYLVFFLAYMLWETVMAPYMRTLHMSTGDFSLLWAINGMIIILFQSKISKIASKYPYRIPVFIGSLIFASSFVPLLWSNKLWEFIIIFFFLTLGEMMVSPQIPAWISTLVPHESVGFSQGYITSMQTAGRVISPLYAGIMVDNHLTNWLFISVIFLIIFFAFIVDILSRQEGK